MFRKFLVNTALLVAIFCGMAIFAFIVLPRIPGIGPSTGLAPTATVLREVQGLSQLVTVKYVMDKVVIYDDPGNAQKWYEFTFGESRVLIVAHGIVKAGVDLSQVRPGDISVSGKSITLKLPPPRVTDRYLDDRQTQIVEHKTGILRTYDKDLEQHARVEAVTQIESAARSEGILKDAQQRAKDQLTELFHQLGFEQVDIQTR
jgi:hypothetical protein